MAIPEIFQEVFKKKGWPCEGNHAEVALDSGRKQTVFLETFVHEGDTMIRAYTNIGESHALSETRLHSALGLNFGLPHGALAIHGGQLVMTDTFLLKDADEAEVEASIRFLAVTADRYEDIIYGTDQN